MPIDISNINLMPLRTAITQLPANLSGKIKPDLLTKWNTKVSSPALLDALVEGMEAGYAALKDADTDPTVIEPIANVVGQVAYLVYQNGFWEQGKNGRALDIYQACRRAVGETLSDGRPIPGDDPEPAAEFTATSTVPPVPQAPAAS